MKVKRNCILKKSYSKVTTAQREIYRSMYERKKWTDA